jgi:SAM-dependent methyltransferase
MTQDTKSGNIGSMGISLFDAMHKTGLPRLFRTRCAAGLERGLRKRLAALPRLHRNPAAPKRCKICAGPAFLFDVVDFNKCCYEDFYVFGLAGIPVVYYRCRVCSFIFTDFFDSWSAADFAQFIYNDDYQIVDEGYAGARAVQTAQHLSPMLAGCEGARILDYGSGAGHFGTEMRARGVPHVTGYDPYSAPERPRGKFDIVTCFEVLEHTVDPLAAMQDMCAFLAEDGAIILGQSLQPPEIDVVRANWWYIAPRNGHASTFAEETFLALAERLGLVVHWGSGVYGFSRPNPSPALAASLGRLGPTFRAVRLCAPAGPDGEDWYEPELYDATIPFRWTRRSEVAWRQRPFYPGHTTISIPFLMEIAPGFATGSRLFVGETAVPVAAAGKKITGSLHLSQRIVGTVRLVTPQPLCPHALNGSPDRRTLGLAIPLEGAAI